MTRRWLVGRTSLLGQSTFGVILLFLLTSCSLEKIDGQFAQDPTGNNYTNSTDTGADLTYSTTEGPSTATGEAASYSTAPTTRSSSDYRWWFYTVITLAGAGWLAAIIVCVACFTYTKKIRKATRYTGSPNRRHSESLAINRRTLDRMNHLNGLLKPAKEGDEDEELLREMTTDDNFLGKTLNNPLFNPNAEHLSMEVGQPSPTRLMHGLPYTSDPDSDRQSELERNAQPPPVPSAPRPGAMAAPPQLPGAAGVRPYEQTRRLSWQGQEPAKWGVPTSTPVQMNKHQQGSTTSLLDAIAQDELNGKPAPALRYTQHARPPALPTASHQDFLRTQMYEPESDESLRKVRSTTSFDLGRVIPVQSDSSWTSTTDSNRWSFFDTDKPAPAPRHAQHRRPPAPVLRSDNPYLAPVKSKEKPAARPRSAQDDERFMRTRSAVEVCDSSEFAYVNFKTKINTTPRESRAASGRRLSEPHHGYELPVSTNATPIGGDEPPDGYEFPVCTDAAPINGREPLTAYKFPVCTDEALINGQQPIISPRVEIPVRRITCHSQGRSLVVASAPKFIPRPQ